MKNKNYIKPHKKKQIKITKIICPCGGYSDELGWVTGNKPKPRRLRCQHCKKRFMTSWFDCGDGNCWHEKFPRHIMTIKK